MKRKLSVLIFVYFFIFLLTGVSSLISALCLYLNEADVLSVLNPYLRTTCLVTSFCMIFLTGFFTCIPQKNTLEVAFFPFLAIFAEPFAYFTHQQLFLVFIFFMQTVIGVKALYWADGRISGKPGLTSIMDKEPLFSGRKRTIYFASLFILLIPAYIASASVCTMQFINYSQRAFFVTNNKGFQARQKTLSKGSIRLYLTPSHIFISDNMTWEIKENIPDTRIALIKERVQSGSLKAKFPEFFFSTPDKFTTKGEQKVIYAEHCMENIASADKEMLRYIIENYNLESLQGIALLWLSRYINPEYWSTLKKLSVSRVESMFTAVNLAIDEHGSECLLVPCHFLCIKELEALLKENGYEFKRRRVYEKLSLQQLVKKLIIGD